MDVYLNPYLFRNSFYSLRNRQGVFMCPYFGYFQQSKDSDPIFVTVKAAELKNHLRMLWEQHVAWTRFVIMSIVFGLPDAEISIKRLLRNPKDFGESLKPFYNEAFVSGFVSLFTDHLVIAAQLVKAAKAGDGGAAAEAEKRWYANADDIAAALAGANPYWSREKWRTMLYDHLSMTKAEAVSMLAGKYQESADMYDRIEKQALDMADFMANGILHQFPGKFF